MTHKSLELGMPKVKSESFDHDDYSSSELGSIVNERKEVDQKTPQPRGMDFTNVEKLIQITKMILPCQCPEHDSLLMCLLVPCDGTLRSKIVLMMTQ